MATLSGHGGVRSSSLRTAGAMSIGGDQPPARMLQNLSLGNVAIMSPETQLPKKYRPAKAGEISTYQGAGVVPVCRLEDGQVAVLLCQLQKGKKKGVRWHDFGGRKLDKSEFTSNCACRKLAKHTHGLFGCQVSFRGISAEQVNDHITELYQGLANLPLMLRASEDWAKMQLLESDAKLFYNDLHEYHIYLMNVPYIPAEILGRVSSIVDGGKRVFGWLTPEDLEREALAPRLHTEAFVAQIQGLKDDPWVFPAVDYSHPSVRAATGGYTVQVLKPPPAVPKPSVAPPADALQSISPSPEPLAEALADEAAEQPAEVAE